MALDIAAEATARPHFDYDGQWPDTPVFKGYAAPVRIEGDVYDLEVVGTIPPELDGAYIRNSADHAFPPRFAGDLFLNGDGMLHKVRIKDGRADLSTRYVQTEKLRLERAARKALFGAYRNAFTDDPSVAGKDRSTANTSVIFHAGKLLATKEAAKPMLIDPATLATLGTYDYDGKLQSESFTAHAKIDPATGEMVSYGYFTKGVADRIIELYYIDASGALTRTESFEAPYPSMVHDFLLSPNYAIFTICPMTCDWDRVQAGEAFFHWDDRLPTMVGVVPRAPGGTGNVRWFKAPKPVMETHTFNAWEDGAKLNLEHFITQTGWLSQFPDINDPTAKEQPPFAQRWTIDLEANEDDAIVQTRMFDHIGEMPMIDLRFMTQRTRHFWFGTSNTALGPMLPFGAKGPPFTCIGHFDAETGALDFFYAGPDSSPEEPIFVPRSPDAAEGDGWLMTVVGRRAENRTDFVILDARNLSAGPIATIKFPCRVHEGFHGIWIPGAALG
ncbi:carotenoid oxygenase family protein [Sphingomonas sp.]|jgi:carotenoid cleavage dioxygenase|uniref:carotenoid oxygenase family protein n=1 Tax=Sphingomonas sp. TaxID=28214 RepID=UPI002D7F5FDF|nr:carotenoid oxygenase family protein [Sphingomonas sp.]HEU0045405.1 carotenoid oxygenase family protein [Sphingomonas sp.]